MDRGRARGGGLNEDGLDEDGPDASAEVDQGGAPTSEGAGLSLSPDLVTTVVAGPAPNGRGRDRRSVRATTDADVPAPGERIGRFTVLDVLGRGGMSIVLSAYDPRLDRRVAVKLLRPIAGVDGTHGTARARLLREARAMARLRHENVIAVHEAGEHGDQVYLAMEQIDGGDLRKELEARRARGELDWREVVRLFVAAGRGLAAAHQAGMVHRDFKPDNVLVDQGGRVFVGDFGLVGTAGDQPDLDAAPASEEGEPADLLGQPLTAARAVMGTPIYMSPEQHRGDPVDHRTDQFAFCAALYEALYGKLPFAADSLDEYQQAIEHRRVQPARAGAGVPAWVRSVLVRGLRPRPEDRYPSMDALLAEFSEELHQSGFRALAAVAAILVVGFIAIGLAVYSSNASLRYSELHLMNGLALVLAALVWAFAREGIRRTRLNRRLFGVLCAALVIISIQHAGAELIGLSPVQSRVLISLVAGAMCSVMAVTVDRRMAPAAFAYLIAFGAGAAWPEAAIFALGAAHLLTFANAIAIFRPSRARERP